MDFGDWAMGLGGDVVRAASNAKFVQPYEVEKMRWQALGNSGMLYTEGQSGAIPQQGMNIPQGWLVIGGLIVLAMVLTGD